jgi:hypothetical protein
MSQCWCHCIAWDTSGQEIHEMGRGDVLSIEMYRLLPLPGFGKELVSTVAICEYAAAVTFLDI